MTLPARATIGRVARVTGALAVAGAAVGAFAAPITGLLWAAITGGGGVPETLHASYLIEAALLGAFLGFLATPLVLWGLLRHVSFGRVLVAGVPATMTGALIGDRLYPSVPHELWVNGPLVGAMAGFAVAAIGLRVATLRRRVGADAA